MTTAAASTHDTDMATLQGLGAELIARDRWSRDRLLEYQRERLRVLIAHAVHASPYYREMLGPDAARGDLRLDEFPTLPKATLVEEFDRIVTDPRLCLASLEEHLAGPDPGALVQDEFRVFSTSGTSGCRALVVYRESEWQSWVAASLRLFARVGLTPETRLAAIGAPNPLHITRELFAAFRSGRSGAPVLSVSTPLDETVASLNEYQPAAVLTYASVAALLAQEQLEERLRIAPRIVGVSSEVLTDEARGWIGDAWGIVPVEVYASTETLYMATSTPPRRELDLYEDLSIVEVVDESNGPVPPGVPGFKVLVTNLVNRTQPLIRYELSDAVTLAGATYASPLPYRSIAAVEGRSDDILRFPGARGGEVAVHPYRLREPFAGLAELRQYQVVQHDGRLEIRIVPRDSAPADTPLRARAAVLNVLESSGAVPPPIDVVTVPEIERESGHAAKLKLVRRAAQA